MKKDFIEMVVKTLQEATPFEHAAFFSELRGFTKERMQKEVDSLTKQSQELQEFIKDKLA